MTWELQHTIICISDSTFWKIYFVGLSFSRAYILRTSFNIQAGEGSCLDGAKQKISASRFKIFWFLYTGFYCIYCFGKLFFTMSLRSLFNSTLGTLSKKRRSRRRGSQKENFHSNGIEIGWISVVWPPLLLDRVMLLWVPIVRESAIWFLTTVLSLELILTLS